MNTLYVLLRCLWFSLICTLATAGIGCIFYDRHYNWTYLIVWTVLYFIVSNFWAYYCYKKKDLKTIDGLHELNNRQANRLRFFLSVGLAIPLGFCFDAIPGFAPIVAWLIAIGLAILFYGLSFVFDKIHRN